MKKLYIIISVAIASLCLFACTSVDQGQGRFLGKSIGYKDFLWQKCDWEKVDLPIQSLQLNTKGIKFKQPVELQVVYLKDKDTEYKEAYKIIDVLRAGEEKPLRKGIIKITPKDEELNLQFRFNENIRKEKYGTGVYKLYFKILNHGDLDQINYAEAKNGSIIETDVFWQVQYEDVMPPLEKALIFICLFIVALLVLWFALLRWMIFPTFAFDNLQVTYFDGENRKGREDCSLHGTRKIICSASPQSQSRLNKLFCGRIEYLTNTFWTTPVVMTPCGSDGIAVNEDLKAGETATYRMASLITHQNGPRRPFIVKRVKSEMTASVSIG